MVFPARYRCIGITVKLHQGVDEIPYFLVRGMENMCTILMDVDTFYILTIDITAELRSFVYDKTFFPCQSGKISKRCSKETGTNNQIIILLHINQHR